ncbi:THO complex subunit 7 family protein [Sporobolomyces salmoneus]|uniref:THO complex subunit 7 family protein n=1 Tax=Sporobolomyces salmoneus TaxID=183962 RepID=UPI0031762B0F
MDQEAQRVLAESRAQSDTKQLKKAIKEFYTLLKPAHPPDQLEALHTSFSITLSQLSTHLTKSSRIQQTTSYEIQQYRQEQSEIEQQSLLTKRRIEELVEKLERAKEERSRRIEYDSLTRVINRLPDREKGQESQEKLQKDIELLKQEEQTYSETWNTRKLAFDSIVSSLETMQEAIRDEKAEQERRRALDDAEDDDEAGPESAPLTANPSLDPNAAPFVPGSTTTTTTKEETGGDAEDEEMKEVEEESTMKVEGEEKEEGEESIEEGEMDTERP